MTRKMSSGLGRAIFSSGALKLAQVFVGLFVSIVMVSSLGSEEFGYYSFIVGLVAIAVIPSSKGTSTLVVREVASGLADDDLSRAASVKAWGICYSLIYATLASVVFAGLGGYVFEIDGIILISVALILFGQSLMAISIGVLRGRKKLTIALLPETVAIPLIVGGLVGAVSYLSSLEVDGSTAMMIRAIAIWCVTLSLALYVWKVIESTGQRYQLDKSLYRTWFWTAIPFAIIGGMQVFNRQLGVVMLGSLATFDDVAIYRIADQLAMIAAFGVQAVNIATAPYYAELRNSLDPVRIRELMVFTLKVALGVAFVVTVGAIVFGKFFLTTLYGPDFIDSYYVLIILATSKIAPALSASGIVLLKMSGHEKQVAIILGGAILLNLIAGFILIPVYGGVGAAIASFLAVSVMAVFVIKLIERNFNISVFKE